tara:strand:- start:3201 stop:4853 length:1653 start_codon:yes stop_codon:yes gene_type:complete
VLKSLEIKNYAIIEHITILFDDKLNIITGETGAGKSILLGALGLTLGERADSKALYNKDSKCFVEAIFTLKLKKFKSFFKDNDLDFEENTSIRREISVTGKSRAFINDTPVTLSLLKALTEQLVNLHSQQETGELNKQGFQISVVDFSAKNQFLLEEYKKELLVLRKCRKTLKEALEKSALLQKDYDFNLFQLTEILEANLEEENLESLELELALLCNAEEIKTTLWEMVSGIDNDEISVLSILNGLSTKLSKIADYSTSLTSLSERLESVLVEVVDLKSESELQAESTELDEERIAVLTEKVNIANKLLQKHRLNSIEALNELKESLQEKTTSVSDISSLTEKLALEISNQETVLDELAESLSETRKKVIPGIEKTLSKTLQKIGMLNAKFVVELSKKDVFDTFGKDDIKFMFSSNKGFEPQELTKIASGGELSRVMLSVKSLLAGSTDLPTLIFDEIDTGISGEVASKVGDVFKEIAKKHQLISITHLPQIASKADKHFFIYKEDNSEKTKTKITALTAEQHVKAIARMLSGNEITEASIENAKLLIG